AATTISTGLVGSHAAADALASAIANVTAVFANLFISLSSYVQQIIHLAPGQRPPVVQSLKQLGARPSRSCLRRFAPGIRAPRLRRSSYAARRTARAPFRRRTAYRTASAR